MIIKNKKKPKWNGKEEILFVWKLRKKYREMFCKHDSSLKQFYRTITKQMMKSKRENAGNRGDKDKRIVCSRFVVTR